MPPDTAPFEQRLLSKVLALAALVVLALFLWGSKRNFNLWDEGFLWYGAQRVMHGEVPIRDFMAYDPARYYWSAGLMSLWGSSGIVSFRGTSAVLQVLALFAGLMLVARSGARVGLTYLTVAALILAAWMLPLFKMTDITASILLVCSFAYLIGAPNARRYFIAGISVGLMAFLGRNHGVYGLAAGALIILWLRLGGTQEVGLIKAVAIFAGGIAIGFMPVVLMGLFIPGFAAAYWDSIRFLFEIKATNLDLPVPWPWRAKFSGPLDAVARDVLLGFFFIGTIAFGVLSMLYVVWQRTRQQYVPPALAAAAFLALPYAHYAFSRADFYHLAFGIFPLLLGCLALFTGQTPRFKWSLSITLLVASVLTMYAYHPGWQCRDEQRCAKVPITGTEMLVDRDTGADVSLIRQLADQYATGDQSFIVTPLWPGAYATFERKSPMWEIYALFGHSEAFERAEIARIRSARPGFVLIYDHALDGHHELRFRNSHPLIQQYVIENYERIEYPQKPDYQIYVARGNSGLKEKPRFLEKSPEELARLDRGASNLRINNWGPQSATAGITPNAQPDGSAGIWIQVSGDGDIGEVRVLFDGKPARSTNAAPGAITAAISGENFSTSGEKEVAIEQLATQKIFRVGRLTVAPK